MKNIWTEGLEISDDNGESVNITPAMLGQINRCIKIQNGYDILSVFASADNCTETQLIAISEELDEILNNDSGDSERAACVKVLGENFDKIAEEKKLSLSNFKIGANYDDLIFAAINSENIRVNDEIAAITGGYAQISDGDKSIMILVNIDGIITDAQEGNYKSFIRPERIADIRKHL